DDGVEVEDFRLDDLLAAEGEELAGEGFAALAGLLDFAQEFALRIGAIEPAQDDLAVAKDDREQVVEVMGDAAGELAEDLHLLGEAALLVEQLELGKVMDDGN